MASKVTPSIPGAPSFSLASAYACRSVSILQTWTYKPQKRQDVSAFALTYSLRLRSCKLVDAFVISSLPSRLKETLQTAGPPRSTVSLAKHLEGEVRILRTSFDEAGGSSGLVKLERCGQLADGAGGSSLATRSMNTLANSGSYC